MLSKDVLSFEELKNTYSKYFSLGYLNPEKTQHTPFERKLILISLINYVTYKNKLKNPDITHYKVIAMLSQGLGLPENFIKGLAIVCEDFAYGCDEFPNFGFKGEQIKNEIIAILKSYLPF